MYAIGEVFDQAREFELAEKYYQKSKDLGLCVVADKVSDAKTTLSMIVNLGGALNDPQLLSIASKLLKETGVYEESSGAEKDLVKGLCHN